MTESGQGRGRSRGLAPAQQLVPESLRVECGQAALLVVRLPGGKDNLGPDAGHL